MAKAVERFEKEKVERVVTETVKKPAGVALLLSEEEAVILHRLLGNHVVGRFAGPRGKLHEVWEALDAVVPGRTPALNVEGNQTIYIIED